MGEIIGMKKTHMIILALTGFAVAALVLPAGYAQLIDGGWFPPP